MSNFRDLVPDLARAAAPWWQGPNIQTLLRSYGQALDENADVILEGRRQGIVFAGSQRPDRQGAARLADGRLLECDPWVIQVHAYQRGIRMFPTDTELAARIRTSLHLPLKASRGTFRGQMMFVRPYFVNALAYPRFTIVSQTGDGSAYWHQTSSTGVYSVRRGSNFNYDGQTSKWSRYWVFIEMAGTGIAPPNTYGSGHTYGDGSEYGVGGLSAAQLVDLREMFLEWKAAHSYCAGIILVWPPATLDITATPTQGVDGRWSLPNGANTWSVLVDPATSLPTRPLWYQWIYDPGPG